MGLKRKTGMEQDIFREGINATIICIDSIDGTEAIGKGGEGS